MSKGGMGEGAEGRSTFLHLCGMTLKREVKVSMSKDGMGEGGGGEINFLTSLWCDFKKGSTGQNVKGWEGVEGRSAFLHLCGVTSKREVKVNTILQQE